MSKSAHVVLEGWLILPVELPVYNVAIKQLNHTFDYRLYKDDFKP